MGMVSSIDIAILRAAVLAEPIFAAQGWSYSADGKPPTKWEIAELLSDLVRIVRESPNEHSAAESGRFRVHRDDLGLSILLELSDVPDATMWEEWGK